MIPAHLDFERVTHRCEADQFHRCTHQQSHFQQTPTLFGRNFDFSDRGDRTQGQTRQRLAVWLHGLGGFFLRFVHPFDHDRLRQTRTQPDTGIANLANYRGICVFQKEFDPLFFAETHFPQFQRNLLGTIQLLDAHKVARLHAIERAEFLRRAFAVEGDWVWLGAVHV